VGGQLLAVVAKELEEMMKSFWLFVFVSAILAANVAHVWCKPSAFTIGIAVFVGAMWSHMLLGQLRKP
jgi:hypothetical protein